MASQLKSGKARRHRGPRGKAPRDRSFGEAWRQAVETGPPTAAELEAYQASDAYRHDQEYFASGQARRDELLYRRSVASTRNRPVPVTNVSGHSPRARERRDTPARASSSSSSGDDDPPGLSARARARRERIAYFAVLADGEHPLELRSTDGHGWRKTWADTPEEADKSAHRLVLAGHDVYVGMAPRLGRDGDDQRRYAAVHVLWTDHDTERSVRKLALFEPEPTATLRSGGIDGATAKRHAIWRLAEPLAADDARRHLRRLAHHLEADMGCTDVAHVLRVPGSRSRKTGAVAVLERFTGEAVDLGALTGELPDSEDNGAAGLGEHDAPTELVPHGQRHPYLRDFAVRLARAGVVDERRLLEHLRLEFRLACEPLPPPRPGDLESIAGWAARSRIAQRERRC